MKRLLSILAAAALVATASTPVVACSLGSHVNESIDPVLEQQNFNVLADLGKLSKGDKITNDTNINEKGLFYSNGLDNDNKFIDDRNSTTDGSFGSTKWSFINMLDSKFNLGLKLNASYDKNADFTNVAKQSDLQNLMSYKVDGYEKLSNITLGDIVGSYQENGNSPVTGPDASASTINAFNKIINIGNYKSTFWAKNGSINDLDNSNWQEELNFINNVSSKQFVDRTYTKQTTLDYKEANTTKSFTFTQMIMLKNTAVINGFDAKKETYEDSPISKLVKQVTDKYNSLVKNSKNTALWKNINLNVIMNLLFNQMNIFTAHKQDYSVSVELDCNDLWRQFTNAVENLNQIIGDYINQNNEKIVSNIFVNKINAINEARAKADKDKNKTSFKEDDSGGKGDNPGNKNVDADSFKKSFKFLPRLGESAEYITGNTYAQKIADEIGFLISTPQASVKIDPKSIAVTIDGKDSASIEKDAVLKADSKIEIKPAADATSWTGEIDLTVDTDNLYASIKDDIKGLLLEGTATSDLQKNDFLYSTLGLRNITITDKDNAIEDFFNNIWIEPGENNETNYLPKGNKFNIENKPIDVKTVGTNGLTNILDKMKKNLNSIVFTSKLNVKDNNDVSFNIVLSDKDHNQIGNGPLNYDTKDIQYTELKFQQQNK